MGCYSLNRKKIHASIRIILASLSFLLPACQKKNISEQTLRLNLYTEPPNLDLRLASDATSMNVLLMLFEGLTRIGNDHVPHLALAEKLDISNDGLTYSFKLKKTYWSNGDAVTSEDFATTWKKILDPSFPAPFAYKFYVIKNAAEVKNNELPVNELGIETPDLETLIIHLNHPASYFLELLSFPAFFPLHRKIDEQQNWAENAGPHYIHNGPFSMVRWDHENQLIVKKNQAYWDSKSVKLKSIHFSMIDDGSTEMYMYEMGELDWAGAPLSNLPLDILPALIQQEKVEGIPTAAVYLLKLNTTRFPFTNKEIRRALALAINRKEIVEHVTQAGQIPACAMVPPMRGWNHISYFNDGDVEMAKILYKKGLKELNLKEEEFPTLHFYFNSNREHQKIAQAIQQQWREALGLRVELANFDWKMYLSMVSKLDYEVARSGWIGDYHDPVAFLAPYKYRDNPRMPGNNETGWENPEFTRILDEADKELNSGKRFELLNFAESILLSDMPVIPIYFIKLHYLKKNHVHGVFLSTLGMLDFKSAYVKY